MRKRQSEDMRPATRFVLAVVLPLLVLVIPALAAPANTITVCSFGCDYAAIQAAIAAAAPGDTILIAAGTYTGQLILKSDLTLLAQDGPTQTIVTASASPIVSGNNLVSVTVQGLGIQGQGISTPSGIDLVDSSLVLSDVIISHLHGANGTSDQLHGGSAVAIQLTGTLQLRLIDSTIQDITGGDGVDLVSNTGTAGGNAIGMQARGLGSVDVINATIQRLHGGHAGDTPFYQSLDYCEFDAGAAIALEVTGQISLTVSAMRATDLAGGSPCHEFAPGCPARSGPALGARVEGGTTTLTDSRFENFFVWPGRRSEPATAIRTSDSTSTLIARTVVSGVTVLDAWPRREIDQPNSPYCGPMPGSVVGIASTSDQSVQISDNLLNVMWARGIGGYAQAIAVQGAESVTLAHNSIVSVTGGSASQSAGIRISQSSNVLVEANQLEHVQGSGTRPYGYGLDAVNGGSATGIELFANNTELVHNNIVRAVAGGAGSFTAPLYPHSGSGGNAAGLLISQGTASVLNNVFAQTTPGAAGTGAPGITGTAVGLQIQGAEVLAINNILIDHDTGLSVTTASVMLAAYNDLWANGVNYQGIAPGPGDVHRDPWFLDAAQGDFHLAFHSPLIDAGFTVGSPASDFDGQARPADGNGDGLARVDIGAYEYQPVPLNTIVLPIIFTP
jgi:hypothetical protein